MSAYFDYAATTPVRPEAAQAALEAMTGCFGNPSSGYELGRRAAAALRGHREQVAAALGCQPAEVLFTSCGTEGDNWALRRGAAASRHRGRHLITTAVEHAAVLETARAMESAGWQVTYLKPDRHGSVSLEELAAALREDTVLVSMMLVNNETGAILPVGQACRLVKAYRPDILFHTDAVQGLLKVPFTPRDLGVDLLTVSGHKIGAPKGIGALYVRRELKSRLKPLLYGGGQEEGLRSGTEPTAQTAAFAAACRAGSATAEEDRQRTGEQKAYALAQLSARVPGLTVVSPGDVPHICAVSLPGYPSQMVMNDLDARGICVSNGSACKKNKPSHVFAALGLPARTAMGVLRLSFSPLTRRDEVDALVGALAQIAAERVPAP